MFVLGEHHYWWEDDFIGVSLLVRGSFSLYYNIFVYMACNYIVKFNRLIHDVNPGEVKFIKWSTVRDNVQLLAKALPNLPEVDFGPYPAPVLTRSQSEA